MGRDIRSDVTGTQFSMRRSSPGVFLCAALALFHPSAASGEGDVAAFVNESGDLMVVGDELANGVFVGRTGEPDEFLVEGIARGGGATTVNGHSAVVLAASGGEVSILLDEGDNHVHLDGNLPGSVTIRGGAGGDWIQVGCPVVPEKLDIETGAGDDLVDMQDSAVEGDLSVLTGAGADRVFLFFSSVKGDTSIETGPGADEVSLDETTFGGDLLVKAGPDRDFVQILETIIAGRAHLNGGPGIDFYWDGGGNNFQGGRPRVKRFENSNRETVLHARRPDDAVPHLPEPTRGFRAQALLTPPAPPPAGPSPAPSSGKARGSVAPAGASVAAARSSGRQAESRVAR